ncbi:hypothetical protein AUC71_07445 [Methyloceanibacter marginalis]|uniref:Uncharacterized protein n=1 Tax=Methyloceanibacter marginalis TaxID=1774971 RepID=A0A1E3WFM3_9HYPH|nr:hypothetical protein AUC71_07445 [Methyloceanibacter marginalis]
MASAAASAASAIRSRDGKRASVVHSGADREEDRDKRKGKKESDAPLMVPGEVPNIEIHCIQ